MKVKGPEAQAPVYTPPPAPAPAQADPAFAQLQQQTQADRDTAIQEQTRRDTAAAMTRYGARLMLSGRASQAPMGLGSSPSPAAAAAADPNALAAMTGGGAIAAQVKRLGFSLGLA